jgi:IS605 OrfB family transposase
MKLIVNIKLKPLESQHSALLETLKEANKSCDWISTQAFEHKIFKQFKLHKLVYHSAKDRFNLSAQMLVRAIAKVADSYKLQTKKQTTFKPTGSIAYDDRIISFKKSDIVSIWTVEGRLNIPFVMGEHQRKLFQFRKGEVDLMFHKGEFYLNAVCDVPEEKEFEPKDVLGVDFGIVNILSDSDGEQFSGKQIEKVRQTFAHRRRNLQRKQTKSAKRKLKQLSGRQSRFQKNENHIISKKLVAKAKDTMRSISLEDLTNIRARITVRKKQRNKLNNWAFADLREKISYKAKLSGVTVIAVNPKNTSRECSACGHISKSNRKTQSNFLCQQCGHSANADANAALNIKARASVKMPNDNFYQGGQTFEPQAPIL